MRNPFSSLKSLLNFCKLIRWTHLPPLMIYLATGMSTITGIVGVFFVKQHLNLSAEFLASLAFWIGLPWVLKLPIGHSVDIFWRYKNCLVLLGSFIIGISFFIMYKLIADTATMLEWMSGEKWFVLSSILAPIGFVIQDVVADAMTVEIVSKTDPSGHPYTPKKLKEIHTAVQSWGRIFLLLGVVFVSFLNILIFKSVNSLDASEKIALYSYVYLYALLVPLIAVLGLIVDQIRKKTQKNALLATHSPPNSELSKKKMNWIIIVGSSVFVALSLGIGLIKVRFGQEIIFFGSFVTILFLIMHMTKEFSFRQKRAFLVTALIVFLFRAIPSPGPGLGWFEIDKLGFDESFFSSLSLVSSILTVLAIVLLQPIIVKHSITKVVVVLSILGGILFLPSIGMYYGIQNWTSALTGGVVDARFIAIINTAVESPLVQVSMIPMLALLAQHCPQKNKAAFFALFLSFSNLALSAGSLGTKYLNHIFPVTREVVDPRSYQVLVGEDYSKLGLLLIVVALITCLLPTLSVFFIQRTRFRTPF